MKKMFQDLFQHQDVSLESFIEFQSDAYARDVEVLFSDLLKEVKEKTFRWKNHPTLEKIQDLTFKRTGIKLKIVPNSELAAVLPFYPNSNSIFVPDLFKGQVLVRDQEKLIKSALEHKGSVDLKKCKVSGIFSEYTSPLYLNFQKLLDYKITAPELTAIFLHELGHIFYSCSYSNRLNSTNQVLASLLREKLKKKDLPKEYLFKELKVLNPKTTDQELDDIINGKNTVLGRKTFQYIKEVIQTQMSDARYDQNSFETLADNFASRWGYGEPLASALQKIKPSGIFDTENSLIGNGILSLSMIITIGFMVWLFLTTFMLFSAGLMDIIPLAGPFIVKAGIASIAFAFYLVIVIFSASTYAHEMTYDETVYRYKRIRHQLIELLKDVDLPKNEVHETIESIKALDEIIGQQKGYKNIVTLVIDFLTPGRSDIEDSMKVQRLLEELSANDLYLKAASIRAS